MEFDVKRRRFHPLSPFRETQTRSSWSDEAVPLLFGDEA
jgi:hypothetical protein